MNTTRDLALIFLAALTIVTLGVLAWHGDVDADVVVAGLFGMGGAALGRLSGANGPAPTVVEEV